MKRLITIGLMLLAVFMAGNTYAQKVSGTVNSASDGQLLIGVNVQVKGTSVGTVTDEDGKYSIDADGNSVLIFSYLGFSTMEQAVNGRLCEWGH